MIAHFGQQARNPQGNFFGATRRGEHEGWHWCDLIE
jgi:hypothetical protein